MEARKYKIVLRDGLSIDANIVFDVGAASTYESALDKAFAFINDTSNLSLLKAKSMYVRMISFKKNESCGLDYGSYCRFLTIHKEV
jgi:hypothetical protein